KEHRRLLGCGRYRDRLIVTVDAGFGESTKVFITDPRGNVLHTIDLQRDTASHGANNVPTTYTTSAALRGELTRFVPYIADGLSEKKSRVLAMLDLELGQVAWQSPDLGDFLTYDLFRAGTSLYLALITDDILVKFDGATG